MDAGTPGFPVLLKTSKTVYRKITSDKLFS